jgi:transposase
VGVLEPFVTEETGRPGQHRRTLNGIFWITRTGAPWRDLPEALGNWNSVYQQLPAQTEKAYHSASS